MERIARFQAQVAHLRAVEATPANYHAAAEGFLAEIDRMQLEVRKYRRSVTGGSHNAEESLDDLLRWVTPENLHGEWDTGPAVGNEVW
ncbi:MAG: AbrB/MazE/SpoVT family DNA-binding domain-containing protein [Dehalococcoidia bacterium]